MKLLVDSMENELARQEIKNEIGPFYLQAPREARQLFQNESYNISELYY
jgi:hypothetical protein